MKIETKITINLDEKEYILTQIEAENLYHAQPTGRINKRTSNIHR
jgi:hypothetical protein